MGYLFTVSLTVSLIELSMLLLSLTLTFKLRQSLPWDLLRFDAVNCFDRKSITVSFSGNSFSNKKFYLITLKRLGWGQTDLTLSTCGFSRKVSSEGRLKPWFFMTFVIIISHIFPENVIKIPEVVEKIWRSCLSILAIFINFHQFSEFFWHFVVTRKVDDVSF